MNFFSSYLSKAAVNRVSKFLIITMLLNLMMVTGTVTSFAETDDFFGIYDITLSVANQSGEYAEIPVDYSGEIDPDSKVKLEYLWRIGNDATVVADSEVSTDIPDIFDFDTSMGPIDLIADVDGDSVLIGNWRVDVVEGSPSKFIIEFEDNLDAVHGIEGGVSFSQISINESKITTVPQIIIFTINGESPKTYTLLYENNKGDTVTKEGTQNETNSKLIDWTIDVNTNLETDIFEISDELLGDQKYSDGTIAIEYLTVNYDGNLIPGSSLTEGTDYSFELEAGADDKKFDITFTENENKAYRITYQSEITKEGLLEPKETFDNTVTVNDTPVTATATCAFNPILVKTGVANAAVNPDKITWTLIVNPSKYSLTNVVITKYSD